MRPDIESVAFVTLALAAAAGPDRQHLVPKVVEAWAKAEQQATRLSVQALNGGGSGELDREASGVAKGLIERLSGLFGKKAAAAKHLTVDNGGDPRGNHVITVNWDGCTSNLFAGGLGILAER